MLALALHLIAASIAAGPAPEGSRAEAPAFDEPAAKAHYEAFLFRLFAARWGEEKAREQLQETAKKTLPAVTMSAFPVDKTRGVYTNAPRGKLVWRAVGLEAWPEDGAASKSLGALAELDYHFEYGFNGGTAPTTCVAAKDAGAGFHGAAACYFAIKAEYFDPGFWVALREVDGRVVVAGVLEHQHALEDPVKDRGLKAFLAAIDGKFGKP